jgi:hypothetical protein
MRLRCLPGSFALVVALLGCTTYKDQLARGQRAFEQNEHDRALAILRDLEPDVKRLTPPEQAEYAYLRGMSDYRIGYKADARHWLSVTQALEEGSPGLLPSDWKTRVTEALTELNDVVYAQGTTGLTTGRRTEDEQPQPPKADRAGKKDAAEPPSEGRKTSPKPDAPSKEEAPASKKDETAPAKPTDAPKKSDPAKKP